MKNLISTLGISLLWITCNFAQEIWNVKAIFPDGILVDVKAIDEVGNKYDVKAYVENKNTQFLDVKAIKDGKQIPIKILMGDSEPFPGKAIDMSGKIYDIKGFSKTNIKYDIKGVSAMGNVISIKALAGNKEQYGVKAISLTALCMISKESNFLTINKKEKSTVKLTMLM
ncbi:MAG: hypothetical protein IPM92_10935 [Saprospiraceae bacterium]|nr:hypothetical protein [Saprospiraceae bacterium]